MGFQRLRFQLISALIESGFAYESTESLFGMSNGWMKSIEVLEAAPLCLRMGARGRHMLPTWSRGRDLTSTASLAIRK